ncbi:unnamed protein product, partial [Urochloa humidicola]
AREARLRQRAVAALSLSKRAREAWVPGARRPHNACQAVGRHGAWCLRGSCTPACESSLVASAW